MLYYFGNYGHSFFKRILCVKRNKVTFKNYIGVESCEAAVVRSDFCESGKIVLKL